MEWTSNVELIQTMVNCIIQMSMAPDANEILIQSVFQVCM